MDIEQPELAPRAKKSRTPLIIGIVVALHVILIGSAFIIQEVKNRHGQPADQASTENTAAPTNVADAGTPADKPEADPWNGQPVRHDSVASQAHTSDIVPAPAPVPQQAKADVKKPAPAMTSAQKPVAAIKTIAKSYVVQKGDTWTAIAAKLKVPAAQLAKENKLDAKKFLRVGQKLAYKETVKTPAAVGDRQLQAAPPQVVSAKAPATAAAPAPAPTQTQAKAEPAGFVTYEVKKGDTLGSIAARHAMKISELRSANALKNDKIVIGQKLKVQQPGPKPAAQNLLAAVQPRDSAPQIHVVAKGDTVSEVAKKYGVSTTVLMKANNISDPNKVLVGDKLRIPPQETKTSVGDFTAGHAAPAANPRVEAPQQVAANL